MSGSILSFTAMAIAGRAVSSEHDTFETMLFRSIVGFGIVFFYALSTGHLRDIGLHRLGYHALRNLAHFTGQNLWFYALAVIPMAQVFALEFTSPLWVIVLAPFLLGEKISRQRLIAASIGFLGILLIARPETGGVSAGMIAGATAAIAFALTAIMTRKLTQDTTTLTILFWLTGMQLLFGLISAGWDFDISLPEIANIPWFVLIGCTGLLAHLCLTNALSLAPASKVIPIDFTRLPLIALIGAVFYNEPITAGLIFGAALIFAGNILNLRGN
ncbi:DMT family transporter [Aliiroseovarius salicola]